MVTFTQGPENRQWGPAALEHLCGHLGVYVRRLLAALGLEGLLLAVRTLSVTRLRFRLSAPSLHPKSEEFFSLSLLDFSNAFPKLPEDEKTEKQNHLAENRIYRDSFHFPVQLEKSDVPQALCTQYVPLGKSPIRLGLRRKLVPRGTSCLSPPHAPSLGLGLR